MAQHPVLVAGMTDADTHPPVILAELIVDITDAVMTAGTTANLDPHLTGREVQFIIDDDNFFTRQLVEFSRCGDGLTVLVDEIKRLDCQALLPGELTPSPPAPTLAPARSKRMDLEDLTTLPQTVIVTIIPRPFHTRAPPVYRVI